MLWCVWCRVSCPLKSRCWSHTNIDVSSTRGSADNQSYTADKPGMIYITSWSLVPFGKINNQPLPSPPTGQPWLFQHGSSFIWSAVEAGGGSKDGELKPEAGTAGQLQPPDQAGDGGVQHEGQYWGGHVVNIEIQRGQKSHDHLSVN